jgi:hypothetical protein
MNYHWSKNPQLLADTVNQLMAGLGAAACLVTAMWVTKEGDQLVGATMAPVGALQIWAALLK